MAKEYTVYKGEDIIVSGTAKECAQVLNIKPESVRWLATQANLRRIEKRQYSNHAMVAVCLDD
ncbi:hypothetical protein [Alkalibacillus salilacus]|uniref:DNA-binding protein n=1 Tax=Alkalibacillus salilacus TaxID=284582 RepID=A0ABT9VCY8_9BACI|nr:hypothetical protein [Alkalibacillus salilacus]MDQ0158833.1 hypothetical protein [Alkalibacillus salilacus]